MKEIETNGRWRGISKADTIAMTNMGISEFPTGYENKGECVYICVERLCVFLFASVMMISCCAPQKVMELTIYPTGRR
jgi:hypothetical protein